MRCVDLSQERPGDNEWNFALEADRSRARKRISEEKPAMVILRKERGNKFAETLAVELERNGVIYIMESIGEKQESERGYVAVKAVRMSRNIMSGGLLRLEKCMAVISSNSGALAAALEKWRRSAAINPVVVT